MAASETKLGQTPDDLGKTHEIEAVKAQTDDSSNLEPCAHTSNSENLEAVVVSMPDIPVAQNTINEDQPATQSALKERRSRQGRASRGATAQKRNFQTSTTSEHQATLNATAGPSVTT